MVNHHEAWIKNADGTMTKLIDEILPDPVVEPSLEERMKLVEERVKLLELRNGAIGP